IDHHTTNSEFAFHNFVNKTSAAVGEIIYQLIMMMGLEIDEATAMCLYVAIATDTGGFRFSNTTPLTHQIASDLVNCGIDVADISQRIFNSTSLGKVRLTGIAIDSLELFENGKIATISITSEDMVRSGALDEDCDGVVNIARNIIGVQVAAMIRQKTKGEVKVNLRSNTNLDVAAVAGMYGGGGHKKAAGYTFGGTLEDAKTKLLKDLQEALQETL
ncbi:MAG: bifunctional oligoribonuclease/PAP phosphatase NrnA, partial [Clostridiales bacterium]|nr:bifunctional oligoribonuclease/PAP phosphatase NrnA [Clostridiales bacterium]